MRLRSAIIIAAKSSRDHEMIHFVPRPFLDHPRSVGETYFQHMKFAGWFASRLFLATMAAIIHAIIPCMFEKTASRMDQ